MPPLPIVAAHRAAPPPPVDPARPDVAEADLVPLLGAFYDAVGGDPRLAPYFAALDMRAHIPRIADFWSTMLWHTGRYAGRAFRPHLDMPGLDPDHFARWVATLEATVDARHAGPMAEQIKALGHRIAYSMQLRLGLAPFAAYARAERR
jgi:hemoglobin